MTTPGKPAFGGTVLRIAAIQSPNFVAGSSGWAEFQDGSAEFNNVTIRGGTIEGGTSLYYAPAPGPGTLVASISAGGGTDPDGNAYLAGVVSYFNNAGIAVSAVQSFGGSTAYYLWTGTTWAVTAVVSLAGSVLALSSEAGIELDNDTQSIGVIWASDWTDITTFDTGFSAGSPSPQYCVEAIGTGTVSGPRAHVRMRGEVILTGTTAANAVMFTVPFGFARAQGYVTPNNLSGYTPVQRVVSIVSSGNVQCAAAGSNTNFVLLDGIVAPVS